MTDDVQQVAKAALSETAQAATDIIISMSRSAGVDPVPALMSALSYYESEKLNGDPGMQAFCDEAMHWISEAVRGLQGGGRK